MAKKKNNSLGWLEDLTRTFRSGIRIRHKVPTAVAGKTASDVVGHLSSKNYFYMHPNQIYGTYDRMIRYSDFAEMEFTPECASALDIYAEECTSRDENGHVLKVISNNSRIKEILESFFSDVIAIDHNIFAWVRNLCKYGDFFLFVDIHPNYGVTNVFPIPVDQIEREEGYDNEDPFAVRFNWITNGNQHLENHQVVHFRLLGNDSFLPYGSSLLEPSRRIWRQLCVASGELVLTDRGYHPIDLIEKGDVVYAWDPDTSSLKKTKVVAQKNMGKQDVYEVRTAHRSVKVTDKHGLMILDGDEHYYKQAQEIEVGKDKLPLPVKTGGLKNPRIKMYYGDYSVKLKEPLKYDPKNIMEKIRSCNTDASDKNCHAFLNAKRKVSFDDFDKLLRSDEILGGDTIITSEDIILYPKNSRKKAIIDFNNYDFKIDESFAELFGFLLGDGWIGDNRVGFADGICECQNKHYRNLLEMYSQSKAHVTNPIRGVRGGQTNVFSKEFAEILKRGGFRTGCTRKNVPSWAFESSLEIRRALVEGYFNADGSNSDGRITSVNYELLEGIRQIAMMSGIPCGGIKEDRPERIDEYDVKRQQSYRLYVNMNKDKWSDETTYETVLSYEIAEKDVDTYDIQVEDDLHNFIVSGVVSHNTLLEDAVMVYRLVRSPERRVFKIDVGNIPPEHVDAYVEKVKSKMKRQIVTNERTGRVDLRYSAMPIHKDSPIPLLDGRTISIEDLAKEYDEGKENWVYSVQDGTKEVVPGKVAWCGKNYDADLLVKVTLDDDSYVLAAPEHPFVLRDGSSLAAKDLKPEMALMPFNTDVSSRSHAKMVGYERVYNIAKQKYEWTHKLVAKDIYKKEFAEIKSPTIHHKSPGEEGNKLNNHPSNLKVMNFHEHLQWHRDNIQHTLLSDENIKSNKERLIKLNQDEAFQKKRLEALFEYNNLESTKIAAAERIGKYNNSILHKEHNKIRSKSMQEVWKDENSRPEIIKNMSLSYDNDVYGHMVRIANSLFGKKISADKFCEELKNDVDFVNYIQSQNQHNNRNELKSIHRHRILSWIRQFSEHDNFRSFYEACGEANSPVEGEFVGYQNHKVKSIDFINCESEGVYCMTVVGPNGEDDRHNFALCSARGLKDNEDALNHIKSASENITKNINNRKDWRNGVFVLNTVEDDYYIPVRGDRGSEIQTLAGGQYTGDIQDIEYMQGKLFAALKIPRSYLGYNEGETAANTLSQIDIRFNKMIQRIQRVIESELKKLAMIHLYAFGFRGEDLVDFDLKLTASSMLSVQQNQEIWRSRFELMGNLPDVVSKRWAMKTIMGFDDYELEEIFKDKIREAEEQLIIDAIAAGDAGDDGLGGGMGGGGGGFGLGDLGGTGDDVDDIFSDDFSGGDADTGGGDGGDFTGGSGPAGSEVEDLFAGEENIFDDQLGPFGPDGSVLVKDKDRQKKFDRRRKQQAVKNAILFSKRKDDEEDDNLDPVQRTGDSGRENAPGQGRKREPGSSPDIRSGDGTGKRHVSTSTGKGNPVVKRNKDELISDTFKRKLRTNPIQNRELQSLRNSLQSAFKEKLVEETELDLEDLKEEPIITENKNNQELPDQDIINKAEEDNKDSSESGENEDA